MEDFEGLMPLVDDFRQGNEEEEDDNGLPETGERPRAENLKSRRTPKSWQSNVFTTK